MAGDPRVLGLLEEMLDAGKTPEEVCRGCPELLPEVRQRWQEFRRIDAQLMTLLPGLGAPAEADALAPAPLLAGAYAGPHERARFQREAEAVAGLRHGNIVQVYDVGDHEGRPYFTMEFVEGGSLAQALTGTPQPSIHASELLATLAEAVQVAHRGGIVHRDLKPANI